MPKIEPFERYAKRYENWFEKNKSVYESELKAIKNVESVKEGYGGGSFIVIKAVKWR